MRLPLIPVPLRVMMKIVLLGRNYLVVWCRTWCRRLLGIRRHDRRIRLIGAAGRQRLMLSMIAVSLIRVLKVTDCVPVRFVVEKLIVAMLYFRAVSYIVPWFLLVLRLMVTLGAWLSKHRVMNKPGAVSYINLELRHWLLYFRVLMFLPN